ncbi:ClC family H(+)/Cl(-) exchange transporter [Bifidobacterium simiarum]|uniref:ClC family H(+)/Cl(-) exchange transporter n=1 Tax=Bifidobacterium simiarum TaxID=2045441 RepID=A0A2M9HGK8_9BIFI|nr:ClC family H(+)/Cl(-) exchange transporter [Bifidobacterium simiarum]PJM75964.1 ClC family H(+)/Cl(-) exchange transporter [Bifidobacterium simiarum]
MAAAGVLIGVVSGVLVVLYRLGIEYGVEFARWMYAQIRQTPWLMAPWAVAALAAGLLIAWMIRREPMASGSGIPQTEGVVLFGLKMRWQTILPVRFIGGLLAGAFGLSMGREGPSIQIGACGAQFVAHRLRRGRREDMQEHYLVTAGAAAGLSAAFSAPLSGMMFALEGVHRSFSPAILMGATAASLTADFVSKYCFGLTPVLDFGSLPQLPIGQYVWVLPVGLIAGLIGVLMNRSLLGFQTLFGKLPAMARPVVALGLALPVGLLLPQVLGGGANLIALAEHVGGGMDDGGALMAADDGGAAGLQAAAAGFGSIWDVAEVGLGMMILLFVAKILFTSTSFGAGTPGGIFMPILSVGALGGGICGLAANQFAGLPAESIPLFAVCGMAGTLSASVKTPITSILLTVEMSGTVTHMLPVALSAFIGLLVSDVLHVKPIYGALLERYMKQHPNEVAAGTDEARVPSKVGRGVMEFPVEMGAPADMHRVRDVAWPSGCLIVGLRRGESEIVPRGDTEVRAGDYLIVLFSGEEAPFVRDAMNALCRLQR